MARELPRVLGGLPSAGSTNLSTELQRKDKNRHAGSERDGMQKRTVGCDNSSRRATQIVMTRSFQLRRAKWCSMHSPKPEFVEQWLLGTRRLTMTV
jgi:hypothetical protein